MATEGKSQKVNRNEGLFWELRSARPTGLPVKTEQCPEMPRAAGSFRKLFLPPELFCTCAGLLSPHRAVHLGRDTVASTQRVQGQGLIQTPCVHRLPATGHQLPTSEVESQDPAFPPEKKGDAARQKGTVTKTGSRSAQNPRLYFPPRLSQI